MEKVNINDFDCLLSERSKVKENPEGYPYVYYARHGSDDWTIPLAESVMEEIKEDGENPDDVLDCYLQQAYRSVYSREPRDAAIVIGLVREFIGEMEDCSPGV